MNKMPHYRPSWVEVDCAALAHNFRLIKKRLLPGTKIMAAVKANAYGHGIVEVARSLVRSGADYLGVACVDEALVLRRHGIKGAILILGAFLKGDAQAIVRHEITATVADLELAKHLNQAGRRQKKKVKVHVKIDTGMGRLGIWHEEAEEFILALCGLEYLCLEGLYTHFPSADCDEAFTRSQVMAFCAVIDQLECRGVRIPLKHTANSMAIIGFKDTHFNLVRPGLALYGLHPKEELLGRIDLRPVLSFKTKIVFLKKVPKGRSISYGRTYVTKKATTIATLPVGYGDGYNRLLSNKGKVLIKGHLCPIVGVVCMDQTMVDVGSLENIRLEDEVVLIGAQGKHAIRTEDIAKLCDTIPYEVVCWISSRVPRIYLNK
ncbi:MAG: alanine racemase [Candidatus Omnitrophota bacterium]